MVAKSFMRWGAVALCLAVFGNALPRHVQAEDLPPVDASYVDVDPAAQRVAPIDFEDSTQRSLIENAVRREPRNVVVRLQHAQYLLDRGMRARVPRELQVAARAAGEGSTLLRTVHFNAGWMLYRMGDAEGARAHWLQAWRLHGGHPDWVPVAFALALWSQGDRETALAYFKSAAAARPDQWGSAEAVEASTMALGANERFALQSMQQAASSAGR